MAIVKDGKTAVVGMLINPVRLEVNLAVVLRMVTMNALSRVRNMLFQTRLSITRLKIAIATTSPIGIGGGVPTGIDLFTDLGGVGKIKTPIVQRPIVNKLVKHGA